MSKQFRNWLRTLGAPEDPVATDTTSEWSAMSLLKAIYGQIASGAFVRESGDTMTGTLVLPDAGLQVGASVPFSDNEGDLTLQNVDALDATTEETVEQAVDALPNLATIQGHTVTLTGDLIRSGAHSLTITTAGVTSITLPTSGTLATLASPAFTGTPTAPTAAQGTDTTQIATTAFARAEIAALVDSSPASLDTLNELAAALGDDPNFATTVTNSLAGKQPLDAALTFLSGLSDTAYLDEDDLASDSDTQLATQQSIKAYVDGRFNDDAIEFVIDGGGSAITTGVKGFLEIPWNCTIQRATALADQSGSIVVDIWVDTYANYPPTDADSITASAPVTITTDTDSQDSTLTGWTTALTAGSIIGFNVDSVTTVERVTVSLKVTK